MVRRAVEIHPPKPKQKILKVIINQYFVDCEISDDGAKGLEDLIKEKGGIKFLDLSGNGLEEVRRKHLQEAAGANPDLDLQI